MDKSFLNWNPAGWLSQPVFGTIAAVSFAYLLGIILRVFRANFADEVSALFLRAYTWRAWTKNERTPVYLYEPFPFIESLEIRVHRDFPMEATVFFDRVWANTMIRTSKGHAARPTLSAAWNRFWTLLRIRAAKGAGAVGARLLLTAMGQKAI